MKATIALGYLMYLHKWSLKQAFVYLKRRRPSIDPNDKFLCSLLILEDSLLGECVTDKPQTLPPSTSREVTFSPDDLVTVILDQHSKTIYQQFLDLLRDNKLNGVLFAASFLLGFNFI
jgi:hypothetical protein